MSHWVRSAHDWVRSARLPNVLFGSLGARLGSFGALAQCPIGFARVPLALPVLCSGPALAEPVAPQEQFDRRACPEFHWVRSARVWLRSARRRWVRSARLASLGTTAVLISMFRSVAFRRAGWAGRASPPAGTAGPTIGWLGPPGVNPGRHSRPYDRVVGPAGRQPRPAQPALRSGGLVGPSCQGACRQGKARQSSRDHHRAGDGTCPVNLSDGTRGRTREGKVFHHPGISNPESRIRSRPGPIPGTGGARRTGALAQWAVRGAPEVDQGGFPCPSSRC